MEGNNEKILESIVENSDIKRSYKNYYLKKIKKGEITDRNFLIKEIKTDEENADILNFIKNSKIHIKHKREFREKVIKNDLDDYKELKKIIKRMEGKQSNVKKMEDTNQENTYRRKHSVYYEIKKENENKQNELKIYVKNNFNDDSINNTKLAILKLINKKQITSKEKIDEILDDSKKIKLINILHEKNTAEIDDFINSCEEEILLGKIQNEEQLYENINEKIKESLKKVFLKI